MSTIISDIFQKIQNVNRIGITVHANPDGDSLGSMSALFQLLVSLNKTVFLYSTDLCPSNYDFLPGMDLLRRECISADALDLLITLDCASQARIKCFDQYRTFIDFIINIDHHHDNSHFGDLNWVSSYSAVGEMIYLFALNNDLLITSEIARSLYVSLYSDTGGFRFSNTTAHSFSVAACLLETGFDMAGTLSLIYERKTLSDITSFADTLSSIQLDATFGIAWARQSLSAINSPFEAVDYIRMVDGINVAIVFKQVEGSRYKVSFRSKGAVNVSVIAAHFGGGGHRAAAAAAITGEESTVIRIVMDYVRAQISIMMSGS